MKSSVARINSRVYLIISTHPAPRMYLKIELCRERKKKFFHASVWQQSGNTKTFRRALSANEKRGDVKTVDGH